MSALWEPLLSARDRAHLAVVGQPVTTGIGDRPGLLLVDNYRRVFGDDRPLLDGLVDNRMYMGSEALPAVAAQRSLLDDCRELGLPVIHVTGDNSIPGLGDGRRHPELRGSQTGWVRSDPDGFRIIDQLAPVGDEFVITKSSPSAFFGTNLAGLIQMLDIDTLIICGESTSGCVRASVVDAASHRLRVVVPADCVYDRHESTHAMSLFDMAHKYADVMMSADVVAQLRSR